MRKLNLLLAACILSSLVCAGGLRAEEVTVAAETNAAPQGAYYVGGMTAGFTLSAGGTEIIGLNEVITQEGASSPAKDAGIRTGDTILAVDGIKISTIADLNNALERCGGKSIVLVVRRGSETAEVTVMPAKEAKSGKYKLGILIRDALSGIGTVTYIEKSTGKFGALGHAVCDNESGSLEISDPKVYLCSVIGVTKGTRGKAGELRGLFYNDKAIAKAESTSLTGLYGTFESSYDYSSLLSADIAPLAEATIGKAVIYSTIDGVSPKPYEISIVKVDANHRENKNFVIKVTDKTLIEETGGIVQGMSGSPILQNGKLIGAVTHVFLNDPTRGYGIGIENMIKNGN